MSKATVVKRDAVDVFMYCRWLIPIQGRSGINKAKSLPLELLKFQMIFNRMLSRKLNLNMNVNVKKDLTQAFGGAVGWFEKTKRPRGAAERD